MIVNSLVRLKQMKREDWKNGTNNLNIFYSFFRNKYGMLLVASTNNGICNLLIGTKQQELLKDLKIRWPHAFLTKEKKTEHQAVEKYINDQNQEILLCIKGTEFQLKVWRTALAIPKGKIISYKDIAVKIGHPKAVRAVGSALAKNPVALIIACHRVKSISGKQDNYRWGIKIKDSILKDEVAESKNKR